MSVFCQQTSSVASFLIITIYFNVTVMTKKKVIDAFKL